MNPSKFFGDIVVFYLVITAIALGAINIPLLASIVLNMGIGAHSNVTNLRNAINEGHETPVYPWGQ